MGKRGRRRGVEVPEAEPAEATAEGHRFLLRTALTPKTRREYAEIAGAREDAWQRRVEFLFERLVAGWEIEGIPVERKELLGRLRFASQEERRIIRDVLRAHVAEHFPDVEAP